MLQQVSLFAANTEGALSQITAVLADRGINIYTMLATDSAEFGIIRLIVDNPDKPLKAHTLMQTIARANRVSEGKSNGLIVDYIGIVKALRKALADYTANSSGQGGADPTIDKEALIARVAELIGQTDAFLREKGFSLAALVEAKDFAKQALIRAGADVHVHNL